MTGVPEESSRRLNTELLTPIKTNIKFSFEPNVIPIDLHPLEVSSFHFEVDV